jgi:hypothetical protein
VLSYLLNIASGVFAVSAALLWFRSATVRTPTGYPLGLKIKEQSELSKAVAQQSWWSAWAALSAGLAAICQVVAAMI